MLDHFIKCRTQPAYFILAAGRCASLEIPGPHLNNNLTELAKGLGQPAREYNRQDHGGQHADQPENGYG
ncbi:hypothetical protein D3C74_476010 [compost metagenome]